MPRILMSSPPSITGGSPSGRARTPFDSYIQPTLGHGLRIWWALYWRATLTSIVLLSIVTVVADMPVQENQLPFGTRATILTLISYPLHFAAAFLFMQYVVRKRFRKFRISLIADQELEPTRRRTTRIWWTYTWRSLLYVVIVRLVANLPLSFIILAAAAVSPQFMRFASFLVGIVLDGVVGLWVIYSNILDENIAGFRVGLVPSDTPRPAVQTSPATS